MAVADFADGINAAANKYDLDPRLIASVMHVETRGNPKPNNADGLMQIIPSTAKMLGINPNDPAQAIDGAARYLRMGLDSTGSPMGAALHYNGGGDPDYGRKIAAAWAAMPSLLPSANAAERPRVATTAAAPENDPDWQILSGGGKPKPTPAAAAPAAPPPPVPDAPAPTGDVDWQRLSGITQAPAPPSAAPATPPAASLAAPPAVAAPAAGAAPPAPTATVVPSDAPAPGVPAWAQSGARAMAGGIGATVGDVYGGINKLTGGYLPAMPAPPPDIQAASAANPLLYTGTRIAGDVGASLIPGGLAARGVTTAANALLPATSGIARLGTNILAGSAAGAAGAATTSGSSDQSLGQQVLTGAEFGGALGGVGGLANSLIGGISPAQAQLARLARGPFNIPVTAGQVSSSPGTRFLQSVADRMPFSGAGRSADAVQDAFNREAGASFGVTPADLEQTGGKLTTDVRDAAKDRLGDVFNNVAARNPVTADQPFQNALADIEQQSGDVLTANSPEHQIISRQIDNVWHAAAQGNGTISGDTYQALTRRGAPLDRVIQSNNPNVSYYAQQIRGALDDALERSAAPEDVQALQQARSQWRNMKTLEPLIEKSTTGDISPASVMQRVSAQGGASTFSGPNNLGDLARIGQMIKPPPSSGTAERLLAMGLLGGAGGGEEWWRTGDPTSALIGVGGALAASRAAGTVLRSRPYLSAMLANSGGGFNPLLTAPAAAGASVNPLLPGPMPGTPRY